MSFDAKVTFSSKMDPNQSLQDRYEVLETLGEGCFGEVLKCRNRLTNEIVAHKVIKDNEYASYDFERELHMMSWIGNLDLNYFNIMRLIEHFESGGLRCMAFELLDIDMFDLQNQKYSFSLSEVRPMAKQLLMALQGLRSADVIHTDIKPDNIMLVNHKEQPFKVKLIDFGLARYSSEAKTGHLMQPIGYRAPEVMLGLPLSEAMDIWSLACCLISWHMGWESFSSLSDYDYMKMIVDLLGKPSDELLSKGLYSNTFFVQEDSTWRLKTLQEYKDTEGEDPEMNFKRETPTLEELLKDLFEFQSKIKRDDKSDFCDLLRKMFEKNPEQRITADEALRHPFITMDHLPLGELYTSEAHQYMRVTEPNFEPLKNEDQVEVSEMMEETEDIATNETKSISSRSYGWSSTVRQPERSPGEIEIRFLSTGFSSVSSNEGPAIEEVVPQSSGEICHGSSSTLSVHPNTEDSTELVAIVAAELSVDSNSFDDNKDWIQDGDDIEAPNVEERSELSTLERFRASISRVFRRFKPKKSLFSKPKWITCFR